MTERSGRWSLFLGATLVVLALPLAADTAATIAVGDTPEQVAEALGRPKGMMKKGNVEVYLYDSGTIAFRDGKVQSIDFLTPEQTAAEMERRRRLAETTQAAAAEAQQSRIAEGGAERAKKLTDPEFKALSGKDKLAYWQEFQTRFPEVMVDDQVAAARVQAQQEMDQETKVKLQELDDRIKAKEKAIDEVNERMKVAYTSAQVRIRLGERRQLQTELADLKAQRAAITGEAVDGQPQEAEQESAGAAGK